MFRFAILMLFIVSMVTCGKSPQKNHYSSRELFSQRLPDNLNWVTINGLKSQLEGKPPMAVGFDVDDAVVLSSALTSGIWFDYPEYKDETKIPGRYNKINCSMVKTLLPKESIKPLMAMHTDRGDDIYFITARISSECVDRGDYSLKEYLGDVFGIKNMHPVIYAGPNKGMINSKTAPIKENNIQWFYGDDDHDIEAALDAGVKGIRLIRPRISKKKSGNRIGFYKEPVLVDSDF